MQNSGAADRSAPLFLPEAGSRMRRSSRIKVLQG
jgi:hypothetical protein